MKILLVCAAGMSTSLVVNKMKGALGPDEQDWTIIAEPAEKFESIVSEYDVVLLGPQIRFKKAEFQKIADEYGIPVDTINTMDYGLCKGDKILQFAKNLLKNK